MVIPPGMVANPSLMREMTRNADRALGQLDAMPGGDKKGIDAYPIYRIHGAGIYMLT